MFGIVLKKRRPEPDKPMCFLESSAPLYNQKKNLRGLYFFKKINKILVLELLYFWSYLTLYFFDQTLVGNARSHARAHYT